MKNKITRKRYTSSFKSRVALEATKRESTLVELASRHGVHQGVIAQWKRQAIEGLSETFSTREKSRAVEKAEVEKLHAKIGQLVVERNFLRNASVRLGVLRGKK